MVFIMQVIHKIITVIDKSCYTLTSLITLYCNIALVIVDYFMLLLLFVKCYCYFFTQLFNIVTGDIKWSQDNAHNGVITHCYFSPDGTKIVSCGERHQVTDDTMYTLML